MVSSKTEFIVRKAREMSMGFPVFSPGFLFSAFLAKFGGGQKKIRPQKGPYGGCFSLCLKEDSQGVGAAVAGNGAAGVGGVDFFKFHGFLHRLAHQLHIEIGRASCRERE